MPGFHELVSELELRFPDDWWIKSRRESEHLIPDAFPQVPVYEKALQALDQASWQILAEKAYEAFPEPRHDRGKHQFFNLMNEALAYEYLLEKGYSEVRLLQPIRKKKTPDISYRTGGEVLYCEVKTVGVSNEEIGRLNSGEAFSGHLYLRLSEGFLGKLSSAIGVGLEQIKSASGSGLVYVVIQFDDFVLQHYSMYRQQIVELLQSKYPCHEICIRVGVCADHFIWHGPRQASRGRA